MITVVNLVFMFLIYSIISVIHRRRYWRAKYVSETGL